MRFHLGLDKKRFFADAWTMKTPPNTGHDKIAWFRIGIVVTSALLGSALVVSGNRPAAYLFLGYAAFSGVIMVIFNTWQTSSEVEEVTRSNFKRMRRNLPRGILRFFLGYAALVVIIGITLLPAFFISNDVYQEYEQKLNGYVFVTVSAAVIFFFWASGFIKYFGQVISDMKAIRAAARKAKERRAREKSERSAHR